MTHDCKAPSRGETKHLFQDQAASYAQFRPIYPSSLYEQIYTYMGEDASFSLAIDCGSGNGQASLTLAERFEKVVAVDVSANQIGQSAQRPNVIYQQGAAESVDLPDSCADLVTVAQAFHWFDHQQFFTEAHRLLKKGGVLAIWGGRRPELRDSEAAEKLLAELFLGDDYLGPYWDTRALMVNEEYSSVEINKSLFQTETRIQIPDCTHWSVQHFIGYLSTWSAHATYARENLDRADPLIAFRASLMHVLNTSDDSTKLAVTWPNFLILTRKKD